MVGKYIGGEEDSSAGRDSEEAEKELVAGNVEERNDLQKGKHNVSAGFRHLMSNNGTM